MRSKPYMETDRPEIEEPPESCMSAIDQQVFEETDRAEIAKLRKIIENLTEAILNLSRGVESEEETPASRKGCL